MQWLLLILVVAAVAGAYWYMRRQGTEDPWRDMDESTDADDGLDRGESLGGDSYIVGVRTVSTDDGDGADSPGTAGVTEPRAAAPAAERSSDKAGKNESFWQAFHTGRDTAPASEPADAEKVEDLRPQRAPAGEQALFLLHVTSRDGSLFDGPDIHAALQRQKLKFGLHDIYHRITETNGVPESVYSIANILKPGFLDPVEEDHLRTPGLALFLVLPGPLEGVRAMRDMLDTARALADDLGGEVLDDKRSLLTPQAEQYMFDRIAELDRRRRLQANR